MEDLPPPTKKHCSDFVNFSLTIVNEFTTPIVCELGGSVNLEVTAEGESDLQYQWLKDEEPLTEELPYSQVRTSSLHIDKVTLEMECHSFVCVLSSSENSILSQPLSLLVKSKLDQLKSTIQTKHSTSASQKNVPMHFETSPPIAETNFAEVQKQNISFKTEFSCSSIQGSDDVMNDKCSISYTSMFKSLKPGNVLAILGRPGCGKTTLSLQVMQDWANGVINLGSAKVAFLLDLQSFPKKADFSLSSLLQLYLEGEDINEYESTICRSEGEGCCFVIDGLEKYRPAKRKETFISKLVSGNTLPKSCLVVTCRPCSVSTWTLFPSRRVSQFEILGLSKTQIYNYVRSYPFSSRRKSNQLRNYFDDNPSILSAAYVPIQLRMICYVFNILHKNMPNTITNVYEALVVCSINKVGGRTSVKQNFDPSIKSLLPEQKQMFFKLCELAYNNLLPLEQPLTLKQIKKIFGKDEYMFGLIYTNSTDSDFVSFIHHSLQLFLAAVHILQLKKNMQFEILEKYSKRDKRIEMLWIFFFGLQPSLISAKLDSMIKVTTQRTSLHCKCIYEAQKPQLSEQLVKNNDVLTFSKVLTPWDFVALAYVLSHRPSGSIALHLYYTAFGLQGVEAFEKSVDMLAGGLKLKSFRFQYGTCSVHIVNVLTRLLKSFKACLVMDFSKTSLSAAKMKSILDTKVITTAKSLDFTGCNIRPIVSKLLANRLGDCKNLEAILLKHNDIGLTGAKAFASSFKNCTKLKELDVESSPENIEELTKGFVYLRELQTFHMLTNGSSKLMMVNLAYCKKLETLDFSRCTITHDGANGLSEAFEKLTNLKILNLFDSVIAPEDLNIIALGMRYLSKLQSINLELAYRTGAEGARYVSEIFQFCPNLESLNFNHCQIKGEDSKIFLQNFKHCFKLKSVKLSWNYFNNDELHTLCGCLQNSSNSLHELELKGNNISWTNARALTEYASKNFPNLQNLAVSPR